jgi:hypothetical protein
MAMIVVGCGGGADTTTVAGKITFNGQSVTRGIINFQAEGSRPIGGGIASDGTYSVELPPGQYKVRIDAPPAVPEGYREGDPLPPLGPRLVPEKYANFNSSGLTATVTADGSQSIDFNLP